MSNLKSTVIIANHNYGQFLEESVESALDQTYKETVVCVVDDCSTDGSWDIMRAIVGGQEKVHDNGVVEIKTKIRGKNLVGLRLPSTVGPSEARNNAIHACWQFTDLYFVLDADDKMYPNKVEKFVNVFESDLDIGLVYADYHILDVESGTITYESKEPYDRFRLLQECIIHSGAAFRRDSIAKVVEPTGIYDREMRTCEDYDLWIRLTEKVMAYHIAEPLTLVRNHNNNSTNSVAREVWERNWSRIRAKMNARNSR